MPKRTDIKKIMVIGSGPIIIGQACEFDYAGSQACRALREEGYKVILVNSNPATIQTDPETADVVYIEPLIPEIIEKIIDKERPDAFLPTLGGQTGLNLAATLAERGVFRKYGIELIGAKFEAMRKAEERNLFKESMEKIGLKTPKSKEAYSVESALKIAEEIGYPVIIRPSYTLGGTGGGIAYNQDELKDIVVRGIKNSRIGQVLIEESVIGWKEYELEVMRDLADNVVIICSIENFDPMGIHTGDSITCAPIQTLTDKEYQKMRDAAIKIIREIGVETGGSNIQFAVNPENGEMVVIEINPRVSRSSALASKATGFPIAKIAAKLAVGLTLDEIPNDITKETPASFEPTIDYVVVKIPRWPFDKFPKAEKLLTTQMKSVGEVMAIGRNFEEALQKAIRSLEIGKGGIEFDKKENGLALQQVQGNPEQSRRVDLETIKKNLKTPIPNRIFLIKLALKKGISIKEIAELTKIDPWFLDKINNIILLEDKIEKFNLQTIPEELLHEAKRIGFSDKQIASLLKSDELSVREKRKKIGITPTYKLVDTCAAEFEAETPYYYSCFEKEDEVKVSSKRKIVVIGSGPNRIGQGIEFDYCCCHAVNALREEGVEAIMINNNPETVSTDYDTSDRLYFEPLNLEDVENIIGEENPEGIILQFGGQTPINLASDLKNKVKILGTSEESISITEDRDKFSKFLNELGIRQAKFGIAKTKEDAERIADEIGYPVLVRPSYVLGGRAMRIVENRQDLNYYMEEAIRVSEKYPVLIDCFLENALECEVDALSDGREVYIPAIMEHIEKAGIHSGDSSCVTPPVILRKETCEKIKDITRKIALSLNTIGLINIQFAVQRGEVYVLEANPRASRTIPYLSKATGIPLAKMATRIILGYSLKDLNLPPNPLKNFAVKSVIFPFIKLPGVDFTLSPEMRSTGEVMGIAPSFPSAYFKALQAAGLSEVNNIFISLRNKDKPELNKISQELKELSEVYGVRLFATLGTAKYLERFGLNPILVRKLKEEGVDAIDLLKNQKIDLVINTFTGKREYGDSFQIRRAAIDSNVYCLTTIEATLALIKALLHYYKRDAQVYSLGK